MSQFNIKNNNIEESYEQGLLPQRNNKNLFYKETSGRSNLAKFSLNSENRRILRKTDDFTFEIIPIENFDFNIEVQKQCYHWVKELGWNFPTSSIKNVFTNHIFNFIYIWKDNLGYIAGYGLVYKTNYISHIGYVFYNPELTHQNLPIRLVLQVIIDSHNQNLKYCYLGRFLKENGFYKRNMPGFEYFENNSWIEYNK